MEFHKGYYSLIQYCSDVSRLEAANVGVLLFCPGPERGVRCGADVVIREYAAA